MKKIILLLGIAFLAFSCSDDDDSSGGNCVTCEIIGISTVTCDNGDGTATVEIEGVSQTVDIPEGETFEEFSDCGDTDIDVNPFDLL